MFSLPATLSNLWYVSLVAAAVAAPHTDAQPAARRGILSRELKDTIAAILKNNTVPGYSVAIVTPGQDVEVEFGSWGNRTEEGDKVTPETLFTLASVSKAFTATGVGILIDDFAHGRNKTALPNGLTEFTWSTKVKDLLPDLWELMDPWASSKASVKDILSHVSGLPRHDFMYGPEDSTTDIVSRLRYLRPAYELREKYQYNNLMYMTAAHLVERYSGRLYQTFMSERIFTPLNMSGTTYWPSNATASGHFSQSWIESGRRIPPVLNDALVPLNSGPGGVISSAADMARWVTFLLGVTRGEEEAENAGVPTSAVREATTPHSLVPPPQAKGFGVMAYGSGWDISTYRGHKILEHGGSVPGISTAVTLFPDDNFGVVQLANADGKEYVNSEILWKVVNEALGIPPAGMVDESLFPKASLRQRADHDMPAESLPLEAFAGTYSDAGYGSLTLCAPTDTSDYCDSVISTFRAINSTITEKQVLLGRWPRLWAQYLRIVRFKGGNRFVLGITDLYPEGYGLNKTPFETSVLLDGSEDGPYAEFVVEDGNVVGFGLFGFIGEETERQKTGKTVEERAEVWFRRV